MITSAIYDKHRPEVKEYTLTSEQLTVKILNLGVTITSIVYNKSGDDVVLGYDHLADYERFENYFGATIGRCANRIAKGAFDLNGITYKLVENDNGNSLHGGPTGFHTQVFDAEVKGDTIRFHYVSKDMEEGFPGNLDLSVYVTLQNETLLFTYEAVSDQDTVINFTNHSYFALQGEGNGSVDQQILQSDAVYYCPCDPDRLATGELCSVKDTPFDFKEGKAIGKDINDFKNQQIRFANGYDHYLRFAKQKNHKISLHDPNTGHTLSIETDLPGVHFYVPNYLPAHLGKGGKLYKGHCAVCLETTFMPDAIHNQKEPETILRANEEFHCSTTYTFQ